jgi:hypothetical protein
MQVSQSGKGDREMVEIDGRLEKAEDIPYGTHVLIENIGTRFALTSETVDLGEYEGEVVRLSGNFVEGYPTREDPGEGPPLVNITEVNASRSPG